MTDSKPVTIMALDVGGRRIGVALASSVVRLPQPLTTLDNSPEVFKQLAEIIQANNASIVIIGWPRGLDGQATAQTKLVEEFAAEFKKTIKQPVQLQDEAVTSRQAEAELKTKGKPFVRGDVDALAATFILEDYLRSMEANHV